MQTEKCIRDLRQEIYKVVEDRFLNAVQRAEENARVVVRGELRDQGCARQESFARSEARVVQLVKGIIEQNDSVTRKRQERETEAFTDRIEERLRQVVVVAKSAAETKAREVVALQMNAPKATVTSAVTPTELARPVADTSKDATAPAKFRAKPRRGQERKTRAQIDDNRHNESVSTIRRQERRTRAKMDRIRQDAQEAVRARAATRAAELLEPKSKVRVKS
ncbi:hypothetical protein DVH05_005524 [Phytophthora capsici]|nr:hypothetical protein DVH05_005524 [Phytophthora capsici]